MSFTCLMLFACAGALADDAEPQWGHLKGRVVLEGDVPMARLLVGPVGGKNGIRNIPDESLVVDKTTKGIANVVVYLQKKPVAIHPDLRESKDRTVKFQAVGGRFVPHVLLVRTDQKIEISSPDPFAYNVHEYPIKNVQHGYVVTPGNDSVRELKFAERLPLTVRCDIHPWMQAWWVVLDHPYAAVTGKDGSFEIKNLPVGEHDFSVWQEQAGYIRPNEKAKFFHVPIVADVSTSLEVSVPVANFPR